MNETSPAALVLDEARSWIGTPYLHQSSVKGRGCDCLGLVRGVWRSLYGSEPRDLPSYSGDWGEMAGDENVLDTAALLLAPVEHSERQPGDLLVFRWRQGTIAKHMGFQAEGNRFIHAWERGGVVEVALVPAWRKRIAGVFRFPSFT